MCEFKKIHKIGKSKKNDNIFHHQDYILEKCAIDSLSHWYVMHHVWKWKKIWGVTTFWKIVWSYSWSIQI